MSVSSREEVVAAVDAFGDAVCGLAELSFDALTTPERLALLERLEHDLRRLPVARHALINGVRQQATAAEIGGKLPMCWLTGWVSPAATPTGASRTPPIWVSAAR
jgi:hypothetical protein